MSIRRPDAATGTATLDASDPAGTTARRIDVEALRIGAAVLVITIHITSGFITGPERTHLYSGAYWVALVANMASRCAVPVFFAISGWAMLVRSERPDEVAWLRQRLTRLLVPLLIWDLGYVVSGWIVAQARGSALWPQDGGPIDWLLREATVIVAGPGTAPHLWFLYYLVPMTMTLWLIRVAPRAVADPRTRLVFGALVVALIVPYGLVGAFGAVLTWSVFGWALAYAVFGYVVLSTAPPRRWVATAFYVGATAGLVAAEQLAGYDHWAMAYAGPLVLVQTIGLIGLGRSVDIPVRWRSTVAHLAGLTFGVYLVHLVFVQAFAITLNESSAPRMLVLGASWMATVVLSFAVVAGWHRIPGLDRVLG